MSKILKLISELDKTLDFVPKDLNVDDYVFICSKSFDCEILEHKGIKIYFQNWVKEGIIYYMHNPFYDTNTEKS